MEPKTLGTLSPNKVVRNKNRSNLQLNLSKKETFDDWDINGDYKLEKMLGQGSYG